MQSAQADIGQYFPQVYFTMGAPKTDLIPINLIFDTIFSSPDHKVLRVSNCDRPMSVVHQQFLLTSSSPKPLGQS